MTTIGIDIGSITTKIAVVRDGEVLDTQATFTGYNPEKTWRSLLAGSLARLGVTESSVDRIVATGYGRRTVSVAAISASSWVRKASPAR